MDEPSFSPGGDYSPFSNFNGSRNSDDEYASVGELERGAQYSNDQLIELKGVMGNFEYMPKTFHGIDTSKFGMASEWYDEKGKPVDIRLPHPFLKLKEIAIAATPGIASDSDRMQSVRYMCFIPYSNGEKHTIEAATAVLLDDSIDVYRRYYFFSNNEKYFKLTDPIVYALHLVFFVEGRKRGYPFELIIRSARYVLSFYHVEEDSRQDCLNWLLDSCDDENQNHTVRAECADVLITCGEPDEREYGMQVIEKIGKKPDFYDSEENIHSTELNESSRGIIRALQSDPELRKYDAVATVDKIFDTVLPLTDSLDDKHTLQRYFHRVQTDPTQFLKLTMYDILLLVYKKMLSLSEKNQVVKNALEIRLYQEIMESTDTCATGYMVRMLNILQGFVEEKKLQLRMNIQDELRSVIFARINAEMRRLPSRHQEQILESMQSDDKREVLDFIEMLDMKEELWDEYEKIVDEEKFEKLFETIVNEYIGVSSDAKSE